MNPPRRDGSRCARRGASERSRRGERARTLMTMRLSEGCGTWYPANTTLGSRCSCMRTVFPSVWSSFCTMNVPALETFVSRVKVSFRTPSGSTNFSAREGWFMVPRRFARSECWGQTLVRCGVRSGAIDHADRGIRETLARRKNRRAAGSLLAFSQKKASESTMVLILS